MPLDLTQAQLFLDDRLLDETNYVERVWHKPRKHVKPLLEPELPCESLCPSLYGTVLHWRGKFRMWYMPFAAGSGYPTRFNLRQPRGGVLYAESDDGLRWHKPRPGLFEYDGSRDNNLVLAPEADDLYIDDVAVIDDPEDAEWPLKMLFWEAAQHDFTKSDWGIYLARSKDGIHWDRSPGLALPQGIDRFNVTTRRSDGKYVLIGRHKDVARSMGRNGRSAWRYESEDLLHWTEGELVMQRDPEDPVYTQYYSLAQFPYESVTLGALERMHMRPDRLDVELVWSHDFGRTWRRAPRRPAFLAPSDDGRAWDDTWVNLPTNPPFKKDGQLWFYYGGRAQAHTFPNPAYGAIGLAQLRIDGFASLRAAETEGLVVTKPMPWPGGDLLVNADPRRDLTVHRNFCSGTVLAELRDEANRPLEGYSFADGEPITSNTNGEKDTRAAVRWKQGRSARDLAGRRLRVAFRLRDAHLYAFCAATDTSPN